MAGFLVTPWNFLLALWPAVEIWLREARHDLAWGLPVDTRIDHHSAMRARLSAAYLDRRIAYQQGADGWAWIKSTYPSAWVDEMNKGGIADLTIEVGKRIYRAPY